MLRFLVLALTLATALANIPFAQTQTADVKGASDHKAVGRYDGSRITFYEARAYDEVRLPAQPLKREDRDNPTAWQTTLAGEHTAIRYEGPVERSALEIVRNYEAALKKNGFDVRFFCRGEAECSPGRMVPTFWEAGRGKIQMPSAWDSIVYLLAERDAPDGKLTVAIMGLETKASGNRPLTPHVAVTVVKGKPMETDRIKLVQASEIEQALARDGRIAIYGIYFDFDKAELKAESAPQIAQLAELLKRNAQLNVLIVGHTDGMGAFEYNQSLSQRRAQSVAAALTGQHGIAASRVMSAGAGMSAPVATNRTDEGRARNRRVEIVEIVPSSK